MSRMTIAPGLSWLLALSLAVAPLLIPRSAEAGAPFMIDDAEPTPAGHAEINVAFTLTHRQGETSGTAPLVDANYGAASDLQLHLLAPLAYDRVSGTSTRYGPGDIELGAKYRVIEQDEDGWRPALAVFPLVELPTGDQRRGLGTGHPHAFLPLWLSKEVGDWTAFGGGGYWISPGAGNRNWWYAGLGATRKLGDKLTLGAEVFYTTPSQTDRKAAAGFDLGGHYDITDSHHLLFLAGRGLLHPQQENQFTTYLGYQLTF